MHRISSTKKRELAEAIEEVADQLYAMVAQSFLAVKDETPLDTALETAFSLLWELPRFKKAGHSGIDSPHSKTPLSGMRICFTPVSREKNLQAIDFRSQIDTAIQERTFEPYQDFLGTLNLAAVLDYQLQLVGSTYPGWRVLFYHDVAHALTRSEAPEERP